MTLTCVSGIFRAFLRNACITHALKFGDYNVGRENAILTVPSYMGFFLEFDGVEDIDLPILDIDEVNRLARQMFVE